MVQESLARKFHPAGFEQPEGSRKNYVKPRAELQEAFDKWVDGLPNYSLALDDDSEKEYKKACELVQSIGEIPYREANSLLAGFKPKTYGQSGVGLFISACYNQSPEPVIIFDVDAPEINLIGYGLEENKILVNKGKVGDYFGRSSSGILVNNGKIEWLFSIFFSGIIINNDEALDLVGYWSGGTIVGLREPKDYGYLLGGGIILKADGSMGIPKLKNYLEELAEITMAIKDEESAKRFLQRYGPEPKETIESEIKKFLSSV